MINQRGGQPVQQMGIIDHNQHRPAARPPAQDSGQPRQQASPALE